MRIVLPPSETKTPGGLEGSSLDWDQLVLPELGPVRQAIAADLVELCGDEASAKKALGLGAKGEEWIAANRELLDSPVMPALERYTGVLFDALDAQSLDSNDRAHADQVVWLFSALFGPLRASDRIPRYRLSFDSKLPGDSLKARWQAHSETIWEGEFTIDLRSEGYRALAPLPEGAGVFVKVVKDFDKAAAVGHANKATKGKLVRQLVTSRVTLTSTAELIDWGSGAGWRFAEADSAPGEVLLAVG